jgi:hypothetical protein
MMPANEGVVQCTIVQGTLVQGTTLCLPNSQQVHPFNVISPRTTTCLHFQPPTNGSAFKVPSTNIPGSIVTPSGKPYAEKDLFNDIEAKPQSAWFGADPIRGTMGNASVKFWPKCFCCIVGCTGIMNFFVIIMPACGYFCHVLGGTNEATAWDMYIPCNSTCATEQCTKRRDAQWTESHYLDDSTSCIDGPGIPTQGRRGPENSKEVRESRWARATPAGNILIVAGFIIILWTCCWGAAFAPAYSGFGKSGTSCGPMNGPNTSRLIFTIVALSNAVVMLSLLPWYFSEQLQIDGLSGLGYAAIASILFYLLGAARFVVGTVFFSPNTRNTHASLTGFISIAVANCIQLAALALVSDVGKPEGPDSESNLGYATIPFMAPMLLFFIMLLYLGCGRCYYRQCLAYCATHSDKQRYDKIWSTAKVQMQSAPASNMQASKHGRQVVAHRPPNQMFYVDGTPPDKTRTRTNLTQPFDGNHHPHKRVVVLFHFAGVANTLFQQYINEWSAAVPGTHSKNSPVKSPVRAVQKLQRSYGLENALRLLDLVRASVVCPNLHMLATVVDIIHNDERVKVLREKNAWANGFKSPTGYRNYQIIVQLRNVHCAGFLCEIQWDLESFNDEKTRPGGSGHTNYKKRRNYMGE